MKTRILQFAVVCLLAGLTLAGCATNPNAAWDGRVGKASFDDVVRELGPPERESLLSDQSRVADWLQKRGGSWMTTYQTYPSGFTAYGQSVDFPDRLIRLTFDPGGILQSWKAVYR